MSVISGVKATPSIEHSQPAESIKAAKKPARYGVETRHEAELEKVKSGGLEKIVQSK